ncbi:MAG: FAD-dependent oxidoreductase [Proteobacteria bacterium]|nr:FAD-dependent oxidoreductase [Pseudomonadota bacterium]
MPLDNSVDNVLILGAGLAGLTAARELNRANRLVTVIEADEKIGGLARTIEYKGFRFDLGGHRFVTNNPDLDSYVRNLLGEDCLSVPRTSKILLRNRYFDYPLRPLNAICGFGPVMTASILFDYLRQRARVRFIKTAPVSLQDWVISHFGRTMFDIFFRDYSEKVWGIDCQRIDMSWMEQRIQGLSLGKAIKKSLLPGHGQQLATLTSCFLYPRLGIGQIADQLVAQVRQSNPVHTGMRVIKLNHSGFQINSVEVEQDGYRRVLNGSTVISTIPLPVLIRAMRPSPPAEVLAAASQLGSRDLLTVTLMIDRPRVTTHTWIYIPEKNIPFGRIHEPSNWSACLAPEGQTHLVVEYFCSRGDSIWDSSDETLTKTTIDHLVTLGLINRDDVFDSVITRIANAYPLFEVGYSEHCRTIYDYLENFRNLYTAGRGGMFRYYNMDHAMMAGMDAADDIIRCGSPALETVVPVSAEAVGR